MASRAISRVLMYIPEPIMFSLVAAPNAHCLLVLPAPCNPSVKSYSSANYDVRKTNYLYWSNCTNHLANGLYYTFVAVENSRKHIKY